MKKIILAGILFTFILNTFAQDSYKSTSTVLDANKKELKWIDNFEKAKQLAKEQNKPLLVFFTGSDWCGPCKMLHADLFETEEFLQLANKDLILYEADFPRRTDLITPEQKKANYVLKNTYAIRGYPTMVLLNSNAEEIGRRTGYSRAASTVYHLDVIQKAIDSN